LHKKILSVLLATTIFASAAGCASGAGASSSGTASASGSASSSASEVKWPKNVQIIVPASAGGDSDYNARLFANKLSKKIGSNFVVSNVNGNGGATGTRQVKDAAPDGSSILFYHSAFIVNQLSGTTDYGFDSYKFACIAALNPGNVVTVSSKLGVKSLPDLFSYAKAHPGKLKMAAQTGATSYAVAVLLKQAGLDINIVDAGSASDRLAALVGGHVDIILAGYGSVKDYVTKGDLVPLAMDGGNDLTVNGTTIKAITNQGYDIKLPFYYFFAFPKGTDANMVQAFDDAVEDIVKNDKDYQDSISKTYFQTPTFYNAKDGLAKFDEVYNILKGVNFKG